MELSRSLSKARASFFLSFPSLCKTLQCQYLIMLNDTLPYMLYLHQLSNAIKVRTCIVRTSLIDALLKRTRVIAFSATLIFVSGCWGHGHLASGHLLPRSCVTQSEQNVCPHGISTGFVKMARLSRVDQWKKIIRSMHVVYLSNPRTRNGTEVSQIHYNFHKSTYMYPCTPLLYCTHQTEQWRRSLTNCGSESTRMQSRKSSIATGRSQKKYEKIFTYRYQRILYTFARANITSVVNHECHIVRGSDLARLIGRCVIQHWFQECNPGIAI